MEALPQGRAQTSAAAAYVTTGIFIGAIEGARIFTATRLLPFNHPEARGHQFPTVLQLHGGEDRLLLLVGEHAGLQLGATLQRYPTQPDTLWPYAPFPSPHRVRGVDQARAVQAVVGAEVARLDPAFVRPGRSSRGQVQARVQARSLGADGFLRPVHGSDAAFAARVDERGGGEDGPVTTVTFEEQGGKTLEELVGTLK